MADEEEKPTIQTPVMARRVATARKHGGDILANWNKAKEEGRLTGCGLYENFTLDQIEEICEHADVTDPVHRKILEAADRWCRLAGCHKLNVIWDAMSRVDADRTSMGKGDLRQIESNANRMLAEMIKSANLVTNFGWK